MKKLILSCALLLLLTAQSAYSQETQSAPVTIHGPTQVDKHKRLKALYRGPIFLFRHPLVTFHRLTFPVQHPLQTGKWMETSGFNGLMGGLGAIGNVGTTAIVGAKKF